MVVQVVGYHLAGLWAGADEEVEHCLELVVVGVPLCDGASVELVDHRAEPLLGVHLRAVEPAVCLPSHDVAEGERQGQHTWCLTLSPAVAELKVGECLGSCGLVTRDLGWERITTRNHFS